MSPLTQLQKFDSLSNIITLIIFLINVKILNTNNSVTSMGGGWGDNSFYVIVTYVQQRQDMEHFDIWRTIKFTI